MEVMGSRDQMLSQITLGLAQNDMHQELYDVVARGCRAV